MIGRWFSRTSQRPTSHHPLLNPGDYTTATFAPSAEALLANPAAVLSVPITEIFQLVDNASLNRLLRSIAKQEDPDQTGFVATSVAGMLLGEASGQQLKRTMEHLGKGLTQRQKLKHVYAYLYRFVLKRAVASFDKQEVTLLIQLAHLTGHHHLTPQQWARYLALLIWNGGSCVIEPEPGLQADDGVLYARTIANQLCEDIAPPHRSILAEAFATIAAKQQLLGALGSGPHAFLGMNQGARWMSAQDLASSPFYKVGHRPGSLIIGYEPVSGQPITYSDNESLITIAGAGAGKSQSQVVPNLLRYPGSCIILDIKGELWDMTAGFRHQHFGPVFKFAPTDPRGQTHCYNPFDFISKDPGRAAEQATVFTYQVVLDKPESKDPYWENRGRDLMWAFAVMVAIKAHGAERSMKGLADLMSLPLDKAPDSLMNQITDVMAQKGVDLGISDLTAAASAIQSGIKAGGTRLESVLDTARQHLSVFTRAPLVTAAISRSDWQPTIFRQHPGASLYICMNEAELKAYGSVVRVMLMQHVRAFGKHLAKPGELPITFMLDELPRLGNFESILELQDVGRGQGVRLWMFAQTLGQLRNAFGEARYAGVVEQCRVRSFMQPSAEIVDLIQPGLGETRHAFTGDRQKLVESHELMTRPYHDKIVVTSRGDYPMSLNKKFAWESDKHMFLRPPKVR
jgi:type IV secretion system protein VirD4